MLEGSEWTDVSLPLETGMVAWPGSVGFRLTATMSMADGEPANNSKIETDVHIGTHIDAPSHSVPDGATIDQLPLNALIGQAFIVGLNDVERIDAETLEKAAVPVGTTRLLIKTKNSDLWRTRQTRFIEGFVGLSPSAATWIVKRKMVLVGIDYLSIQSFGQASMQTHNIMLEKKIVIVEGLRLTDVQPGECDFICLPLKIVGAEGAPARAIIRKSNH